MGDDNVFIQRAMKAAFKGDLIPMAELHPEERQIAMGKLTHLADIKKALGAIGVGGPQNVAETPQSASHSRAPQAQKDGRGGRE
jgi:hypothetical protein